MSRTSGNGFAPWPRPCTSPWEARARLEWIIWYETAGNRNARATCRHFGIPPRTFYRWKERFSETNPRALEERSRRLHELLDGRMVHVRSDNGSEFHKRFEEAARDLHLTHWWSRVHTPKDNAVRERFNRTIREEFIAYGNATPDPQAFNRKLADWLVEYNAHRPHAALGCRTPLQVASTGPGVSRINPSRTGA